MMKRLNAIKLQGHINSSENQYKLFFKFMIKIVIIIGFDQMTRKRIENKKGDIDFKKKTVTRFENENKEIQSKIDLIDQIKENLEMNQNLGERRQLANRDSESKEKDNEQKLLDSVRIIFYNKQLKFNLKTLKGIAGTLQKTVMDNLKSLGTNLLYPREIADLQA